jgi:O-antigen/teichoic acid export membrane protein
MNSERKEVMRDSTLFAGSVYIAMSITVVMQIMIRRFLGPKLSGIWSALAVLRGYAGFMHLGVLSGAERELPYLRARGEDEQVKIIADTTLTFDLLITLLTVSGYFIYAMLSKENHSPELVYGLYFVAAFYLILQFVNVFVVVFVRTKKNFRLMSEWTLVFGVFEAIGLTVAAYYFGLYGMFWMLLASVALKALYIPLRTTCRIRLAIDRQELLRLLGIGLPIFLNSVLVITLRSIDQLFIGAYYSATMLGFYSVATMANNFLLTLPNAISAVIYPRLQERYAHENDDPASLKYMVTTPMFVLAIMMPPVIGAAYFMLPPIVHLVLPQFVSGVSAMKILICSSYFFALQGGAQQFLITTNRQWFSFAIMTTVVGLQVLGLYLVTVFDGDMTTLATIMVGVYFLLFLGSNFFSLKIIMNAAELAAYLGRLLLPFIYSVAVILTIEHLWPREISATLTSLVLAIIAMIVFLFTYLPLLYWLQRRTGVVAMMWQLATSALRKLS